MSAGAATRRTRRLIKTARRSPPVAPRFIKISAAGKRRPDVAPEWVAVLDTTTGLTWTRSTLPCGAVSQPQAIAGARQLKLAGKGAWRAPTIAERVGITDYSGFGPALDPRYFDGPEGSGIEWTSTLFCAASIDYAGYVYFYYGNAGWSPRSRGGFVRGVRGAPGEVE